MVRYRLVIWGQTGFSISGIQPVASISSSSLAGDRIPCGPRLVDVRGILTEKDKADLSLIMARNAHALLILSQTH